MTVVRDQLFPQKPPGSRFRFSRTRVQPSPGSSTIELPSAFAESGAYPPDREPPGSLQQCSLPLACRHPPEGRQIGARKRRTPENTILSQPYCRRVSTDRSDRKGSQLAAPLEGEPGPTPAGKTLPHSYPETRSRRERARDVISNVNPVRGHKEVQRSTGHIMVIARHSNQQGSESRQNPCHRSNQPRASPIFRTTLSIPYCLSVVLLYSTVQYDVERGV